MMYMFLLFFVLISFQLSAKHFSVLPLYFMKREDNAEKRVARVKLQNFPFSNSL